MHSMNSNYFINMASCGWINQLHKLMWYFQEWQVPCEIHTLVFSRNWLGGSVRCLIEIVIGTTTVLEVADTNKLSISTSETWLIIWWQHCSSDVHRRVALGPCLYMFNMLHCPGAAIYDTQNITTTVNRAVSVCSSIVFSAVILWLRPKI